MGKRINKLIVLLLAILMFSCQGDKHKINFCQENLIITNDNYNFFIKNHTNFQSCKYISLMRIDKLKMNHSLKLLSKNDLLLGLSISLVELDTFPKSIMKFKNLESLELTDCNLKYVPKNYLNLVKLKKLNLRNNQLSELPYINSLSYLNISNNNFKYFPYEYFNSNNIVSINIDNNNISNIETERVKKKKLKGLFLAENNINLKTINSLKIILGDSIVVTKSRLIE